MDLLGQISYIVGLVSCYLKDSFSSIKVSLYSQQCLLDYTSKNNFSIYYNGSLWRLSEKIFWFVNYKKVVKILNYTDNLYYYFNQIGSKIRKMFFEGKDISEITKVLSYDYSVSEAELNDDIINFIEQLVKEKILLNV